MTRGPALALALCALGVPGAVLSQQPSFGPLTTEEGAPIQRISYTPMSERADVAPPGEIVAELWLGYSNIFEQDSSATHVLLIDMERLITSATIRWGVAESWEIGGRLTVESTGPGFLDSFVLWYHDALGFGQANRDRFPTGQYAQRLSDGDRTLLAVDRRGFALEDVRLFAKWQVLESVDDRSALSLKAEARVPAHANRVGTESADVALIALGRLGVGPWYLHGLLAAATARSSPELEPVMRGASYYLTIAAERSLTSGLAAVVQYQLATPLLRDFDHREIDWPASNLVLGLAGRWGEEWSWDVSFQEDLPADTPAIDFTLGLRISRAWR